MKPNEIQRWADRENDRFFQLTADPKGDYVLWSDIEPLIRSHEALREACAGLLSDYEEDCGVSPVCDCRIEPENAGHYCSCCKARDALAAAKEVGRTERVSTGLLSRDEYARKVANEQGREATIDPTT